jgi:hypothetical protein
MQEMFWAYSRQFSTEKVGIVGTTCFAKPTQPPFCYAQRREEVRLPQHDLARRDHLELLFFSGDHSELDHAGSFTRSLEQFQARDVA